MQSNWQGTSGDMKRTLCYSPPPKSWNDWPSTANFYRLLFLSIAACCRNALLASTYQGTRIITENMSLVFPLLSTSSRRNRLFTHNDWENAWRPSNGLGGVGYTHPKDVKSHDQGLSPRRLHIKGAFLYWLGLRPHDKVSSEREYESKRGLPYPGGIGRIVYFFFLSICGYVRRGTMKIYKQHIFHHTVVLLQQR